MDKDKDKLFQSFNEIAEDKDLFSIMREYFTLNRDRLQQALLALDLISREIDYNDSMEKEKYENSHLYE